MGQLDGGSSATLGAANDDRTGLPVISISGEIDMSNVAAVETQLDSMIATGCDRLVFDLSALEFIDSSGIALLLRVADKIERVELRNPSATVLRVIQVTGLTDVLHVQS